MSGLIACGNLREEIASDGLATVPSKLVVACFISPQDTVLTAKVARSRPLLDNDPTRGVAMTDAVVQLSNRQRTVQLVYDGGLGYYQAESRALPIIAGETYHLTVRSTDGQQVTASIVIPTAVPIRSVFIDVSQRGNSLQLLTRVSWQDPVGTPDFYQLRGQARYTLANQPDSVGTQPVFLADNTSGFFTDSGADGLLLTSTPGYIDNLLGTSLTMSLWHLDAAYYHYHQALALQQSTDGNPFAEPVPIPTNIQGGLGCFGAYNQVTAIQSLR